MQALLTQAIQPTNPNFPINIKLSPEGKEIFTLEITPDTLIHEIHKRVAAHENIENNQVTLTFNGAKLDDIQTAEENKIISGATINAEISHKAKNETPETYEVIIHIDKNAVVHKNVNLYDLVERVKAAFNLKEGDNVKIEKKMPDKKPVEEKKPEPVPEPVPEKVTQEEEKKPAFDLGALLGAVIQNTALTSIKKVVESKQTEAVQEFRAQEAPGAKISWKNTHFIFVIDCSGSMRGKRWEAVKAGYTDCLNRLQGMSNVIISAFTFDDKPNPWLFEKSPEVALKQAKNLPFSGKGTDYKLALDQAIQVINNSTKKDYLTCVLFLSDGLGGYPDMGIKTLEKMKKDGKKLLFYTIACETDEDEEMITMAKTLGGEHLKALDSEAAKIVFQTILGV